MSGKFMMNGIEYLGGGSGGGGGNVDDVYVNGESVLDENKIAQVTSYKEVTLAEYMALPDTKLTDGVMYCIKDVGGANQFPPLIYSDEEREIGVWRDGKPLYQKTISVASINVGYNAINHNITNLDKVVDMRGRCKFNGANEVLPLPYVSLSTNSNILFGNVSPTTFAIYTGNGFTSIEDVYVTLQYTKTTDTAGSGTWTTQGGYAHHYSTTEHVIGTWIDGKPLYEKTFVVQKTTIGTETLLDLSSLNIESCVQTTGWFINSSGTHSYIPLYTSGSDFAVAYYQGGYLKGYNGGSQTKSSWNITLQYTKTTD